MQNLLDSLNMLLHLRFKQKFMDKFLVFKSAEYHFQDSRENKSRLQFTNLYYYVNIQTPWTFMWMTFMD